MQPCFKVGILVLQAERLVCAIRYLGFLFQTVSASVVTKPDYRPYRSSLLGYRFGRSGSSGFAGGSRRLRWSSCVPVPKVCSCRIVSVGNDGLVFAVVERPFFTEVVAAFEQFAVDVVTVVFVAGYLSVGLAVFDHDVVAVVETAQFFVVTSVNGSQIALVVEI